LAVLWLSVGFLHVVFLHVLQFFRGSGMQCGVLLWACVATDFTGAFLGIKGEMKVGLSGVVLFVGENWLAFVRS